MEGIPTAVCFVQRTLLCRNIPLKVDDKDGRITCHPSVPSRMPMKSAGSVDISRTGANGSD